MKFKNFFLSCSTSAGGKSRKVQEKYGNLRPLSPPPSIRHQHSLHGPPPPPPPPPPSSKKHLTNSYSSYSCGSTSSSKSASSGSGGSGCGHAPSPYSSISKNKRMLDSRGGRYRNERVKSSRQCCIEQEFQNFNLSDLGVALPDLGVKVHDRVVWLREPPNSNEAGTVKWIGIIEGEEIAGIEFDRQLNLGSGWYKNRQLFTCEPHSGGLVAVAGLILEEDYGFSPKLSPSPTYSEFNPYPRLSAGDSSSPSPSPSSSSSASLEFGLHSQLRLPRAIPATSTASHQVSQNTLDSGDSNHSHHLPIISEKVKSESSLLRLSPSFDSGDGHSSFRAMPIPHIEGPLREENAESVNGRNKGIQGHRNSCYLDATLFSMFSFSSVFDSILLQDYRSGGNRRDEEDEKMLLAKKVQKILRDDVVNRLRKENYCAARDVMKLRETMEHLDKKLTSEEMDPEEFLRLLFDKVLNLDKFMSLSSQLGGQSDFFHQVLVHQAEEGRHRIPSIQQLFEQSLMQQGLKLKNVPQPALILQMPRSGKQFKLYEGILPNLTIDITDLVEDTPRMCVICGMLATLECSQCYGQFNSGGGARDMSISSPLGSGAESTAFCETCYNQSHKRKERQSHSSVDIKYSFSAAQYFPNIANIATCSPNNPPSYFFGQSQIGNWGNPSYNRNPTPIISSSIPPPPPTPNSTFNCSRSIPRVTMDLFAVICIETSHYVSFVKCGPDRKAPWVFFDSMADRVENTNGTGHNIPQIRLLPKMGIWLDELEKRGSEIRKHMEEPNFPAELKRLLADTYICLYYSKESSMYL